MDNGVVFFIVVIVFFFLLWIVGGGPSKPISFAGPYITPITNENQTQVGYGPQLKVGGTLNLPGAALTGGEHTSSAVTQSQTLPAQSTPNVQSTSPGNGLVTLTHIAGGSSNPTGYVEISVSSSAGADTDITNWSLTSSDVDQSGLIPTGVLVMQLGASNTLQDIVLRPGDKAIVAAGNSPAATSFEGNECTGYLTSNQSEYNSCVQAHVNDPNFLTGTWYVYLGKSGGLWQTSDTVSLLDDDGNEVTSVSF
jgi:hypothetical protein